tara:strand:- start:5278 stop:5541 length:264 start_codon:yes stop_codon:yes gene_type:complete
MEVPSRTDMLVVQQQILQIKQNTKTNHVSSNSQLNDRLIGLEKKARGVKSLIYKVENETDSQKMEKELNEAWEDLKNTLNEVFRMIH